MNLKKDITVTFSGQIASLILGTLSTALLSRGLGAEQRGIYALAIWMPATLSAFTPFGQVQVNSLFAGLHRDKRSQLLLQSLVIALILGLVGILVTFAFFWLPIPRGKFVLLTPDLIILSALLLPVMTLEPMLTELTRGSQLIKKTALISSLGYLLYVILIGIFVYWFQWGVRAAVCSLIAIRLVRIIAYLVAIRSVVPFRWLPLDKTFLKECLRYGAIFTGSSGAMYLINQVAPCVLSYAQVSARVIGLYSVALLLGGQMALIPDSIASAFLPRLSNNPSTILQETPRVFRCGALLCGGAMVGMACVCWPTIYLLMGREFLGSVPWVLAMLPGLTAFGAVRVLGAYLWVIRKPKYGLIYNWVVLVILIILSWAFLPIWGPLGVAIAASLSYFVLSACTIWAFLRESKLRLVDLVPRRHDIDTIVQSVSNGLRRIRPGGGQQ